MKVKEVTSKVIALILNQQIFAGFKQENSVTIIGRVKNREIKVAVLLTDYAPEFDIEFGISIYIPPFVAEILEVVNNGAENKHLKLPFSLHPRHYAFMEQNFHAYTITDEKSLDQSIRDFTSLYQSEILPYIEKVQSLDAYEGAVNERVENHKFIRGNLDAKAILGIYLRSKTAPSTLP